MESLKPPTHDSVQVKVPKKFVAKLGETIEWQEIRTRPRLMPNGYWLTIAAVITNTHIILGASACSPDDVFDKGHAYQIAIGRARQQAFRVLHHVYPIATLVCHPRFVDGHPRVLIAREGSPGIGIVAFSNHATTGKDIAEPYYAVVAHNAEMQSILKQVEYVEHQYKDRFRIHVEDKNVPPVPEF